MTRFKRDTTSPRLADAAEPNSTPAAPVIPDSLVAWLTDHLGEVVSITAQARWRPAWYAQVRQACGKLVNVYVRGERIDMEPVFPLDHECAMQVAMEQRGIPVPHVYGFCDDPRSIVMAQIDAHLDFSESSDAERARVMREYMEVLAKLHQLDPAGFVAAGAELPADRQQVALTGIRAYERGYRKRKTRPDPFMEFCLQWIARNPPTHEVRPGPVLWDSGQLMHRDGRIAAVFDIELAHIGDPMMDLIGVLRRDTQIGFGDVKALFRYYEELTGHPADRAALDYYHFIWALTPQLGLASAIARPAPQSDLMTYRYWCSRTNLYAVAWLAGRMGITLPEIEPPASSSLVADAHRLLAASLQRISCADEASFYEHGKALQLAGHLQRFAEIGAVLVAQELDDVAELTGSRPTSREEGDAALEAFVLAAGPEEDARLIRIFHHRLEAERMLLGPEGSPITQKPVVQHVF